MGISCGLLGGPAGGGWGIWWRRGRCRVRSRRGSFRGSVVDWVLGGGGKGVRGREKRGVEGWRAWEMGFFNLFFLVRFLDSGIRFINLEVARTMESHDCFLAYP